MISKLGIERNFCNIKKVINLMSTAILNGKKMNYIFL